MVAPFSAQAHSLELLRYVRGARVDRYQTRCTWSELWGVVQCSRSSRFPTGASYATSRLSAADRARIQMPCMSGWRPRYFPDSYFRKHLFGGPFTPWANAALPDQH